MNKRYMPMSTKNQFKVNVIHHNSVQRKREENMTATSFQVALLLCCYSLRTEFEFGGKRLGKFIDKVNDILDSYNRGYCSVQDINEMIYDETGMEILDRNQLDKFEL